jgi:hypothetical protein
MTMYFEEKAVMCALLFLFRKKAKKEDVGLSFNQPKTDLSQFPVVSFCKMYKLGMITSI